MKLLLSLPQAYCNINPKAEMSQAARKAAGTLLLMRKEMQHCVIINPKDKNAENLSLRSYINQQ